VSVVPRSFRVLRHRELRLVVIGNLVSSLGTWSQYVGVGWAAKELTDSKAALGLAFAAPLAASLVLAPFAGVIADRYDRRRLVMLGNVAMAVPPAIVGLLLQRGQATVALLVGLVFLGGIAQAMCMPASLAVVPQLVPLEEVQQAVALNSGLTNATRIIGPGIGGFAINAWGADWAFYLNAMSFFAVVVAWWVVKIEVRVQPAGIEPFADRLKAGFAYSRRNPVVGRLLMLTAAGAFCAMHAPLMPVIAKDVLHGNATTYARLSAAPGIGAFLGAMMAGEITGARARRGTMSAAAILTGAALLVLSVSRSFPLSLTCLAFFGLGYFLLNALVTTAIVVTTEEGYRGRVMGFLGMANAGIVPVNAVVAGVVAGLVGAMWTVGAAAASLLVFSTWFVASGKFRPVFTPESFADAGSAPDLLPDVVVPTADAAPGAEAAGLPGAVTVDLDDVVVAPAPISGTTGGAR
jgi:MFS family permease